jgi:hypothetical protein
MDDLPEEEQERLMERARQIHGDNPFSPEALVVDELHRDLRMRTGKIQRQLDQMARIEERKRREGYEHGEHR